jgi:hypothetical protein
MYTTEQGHSGSCTSAELKQRRALNKGDAKQNAKAAADDRSLRVVLLGTGAACPSKYRNVTSIYLDFGARGGMLVDCGEGTWGQLVRCAMLNF